MNEIALARWILIGLAIAALAFILVNLPGWITPQPPNLLLISFDTLRADRMGCYGHPRPTTPTIDGLAREGMLFERVISPRGLTHPALATILTGLEPFHHKVRFNYHKPQGLTTIADVLSSRGYRCRAYLANADDFAELGFDEESQGVTDRFLYNHAKRDREITRLGVEYLRSYPKKSRQPFFLWLHYMSPHRPYTPPEPYERGLDGKNQTPSHYYDRRLEIYMAAKADLSDGTLEEILNYYDGNVRFADDLAAEVLATLEKAGLKKNTLVAFTADHGDELYDHLHYFLHQVSLFDGTLHVPLILRWPGKIPPGLRVKEQVGLVHLMPSLVDLLGAREAIEKPVDGVSFRDLMDTYIDAKPSADLQKTRLAWQNRPVWIEMARPEGNAYGVYQYPYKYARVDYNEGFTAYLTQPMPQSERVAAEIAYPPEMLFNLVDDPDEKADLLQAQPEVRNRLAASIDAMLKSNPDWEGIDVSVIDEAGLERLRAMGYLDGGTARR